MKNFRTIAIFLSGMIALFSMWLIFDWEPSLLGPIITAGSVFVAYVSYRSNSWKAVLYMDFHVFDINGMRKLPEGTPAKNSDRKMEIPYSDLNEFEYDEPSGIGDFMCHLWSLNDPLGIDFVRLEVRNKGRETLRFKQPQLHLNKHVVDINPVLVHQSDKAQNISNWTYVSLESGEIVEFYYGAKEIFSLAQKRGTHDYSMFTKLAKYTIPVMLAAGKHPKNFMLKIILLMLNKLESILVDLFGPNKKYWVQIDFSLLENDGKIAKLKKSNTWKISLNQTHFVSRYISKEDVDETHTYMEIERTPKQKEIVQKNFKFELTTNELAQYLFYNFSTNHVQNSQFSFEKCIQATRYMALYLGKFMSSDGYLLAEQALSEKFWNKRPVISDGRCKPYRLEEPLPISLELLKDCLYRHGNYFPYQVLEEKITEGKIINRIE